MKSPAGHRLTIYLPKPLYRRFQSEAQFRKSTIGKVVRERLTREEGKLSGFDLLEDLIEGKGSNWGDLSCNPSHMKGFGQDVRPVKRSKTKR